MKSKKIPNPSPGEVERYLKKWKKLDDYVLQESSLNKLFLKTYKNNVNLDDVLIKVCALNTLYGLKIFKPLIVAKHVFSLKIDKHLSRKDLAIVNKIANIKVNSKKNINFYSFATKYCSHHNPNDYPIYDYYVEKMLKHFRNKNDFCFSNKDLKDYSKFKIILNEFKKYFNIEKYSLKEIDRYLWQSGKKYFRRKYDKTLSKKII